MLHIQSTYIASKLLSMPLTIIKVDSKKFLRQDSNLWPLGFKASALYTNWPTEASISLLAVAHAKVFGSTNKGSTFFFYLIAGILQLFGKQLGIRSQ